jgi:glycosyltransferase involved in cell wall biosynthesis
MTGKSAKTMGGSHERVAIVAHSHPSVTKGGAEIAAYTLFQGLLSLGVDAIFVAACPEAQLNRVNLDSQRECVIPFRAERFDHFYQLSDGASTKMLRQILHAHRSTIVNFHHFHNIGLDVLRDLETAPLRRFFTFHEFLAICHNHGQMVSRPNGLLCEQASPSGCSTCFPEFTRQQFQLRKQSFVGALNSFDGFISPSRFLAGRMTRWGIPEQRIAVIENGLMRLPEHREATSLDSKTSWTFGFFGQVNPFKGVDLLLAAAESLARNVDPYAIRIRVHGNLIGLSEEFMKRFAVAQQQQILEYAGPYNNANVSQLMAECDYVLVPSRWWENSPVVIQEAYAVGRPVICSGIGGMAEKVIHGVSGLHFRFGDVKDLVRIIRLAADPKNYAKLLGNLPRPNGGTDMAREYMGFFARTDVPNALARTASDLHFV